jgi:hypothetical protein
MEIAKGSSEHQLQHSVIFVQTQGTFKMHADISEILLNPASDWQEPFRPNHMQVKERIQGV